MISPRPSNVGADILPAMPMRPFYGVDVTLVDEKVGYNIAIQKRHLCWYVCTTSSGRAPYNEAWYDG
jgi:hypothetical protein